VITGLIGQWFGVDYAQGFFHTFSSWLVLSSRLSAWWRYTQLIRPRSVTLAEPGTVKQPVRVGISLSLLVGALLALHLRSAGEAVPLRKSLDSFPNAVGQWQAREGVLLELDTLNVLRPKDYLMRRDQDPLGEASGSHRLLGQPAEGGPASFAKNCLPGGGWEPLEASMVTIPLPNPWRRSR